MCHLDHDADDDIQNCFQCPNQRAGTLVPGFQKNTRIANQTRTQTLEPGKETNSSCPLCSCNNELLKMDNDTKIHQNLSKKIGTNRLSHKL